MRRIVTVLSVAILGVVLAGCSNCNPCQKSNSCNTCNQPNSCNTCNQPNNCNTCAQPSCGPCGR
ncbi:MAG TPA: hypothetical protein VND21_09770 [Planctomycetota bacterium]|nr:hypothetical protein [Planctomycetota bacterium]